MRFDYLEWLEVADLSHASRDRLQWVGLLELVKVDFPFFVQWPLYGHVGWHHIALHDEFATLITQTQISDTWPQYPRAVQQLNSPPCHSFPPRTAVIICSLTYPEAPLFSSHCSVCYPILSGPGFQISSLHFTLSGTQPVVTLSHYLYPFPQSNLFSRLYTFIIVSVNISPLHHFSYHLPPLRSGAHLAVTNDLNYPPGIKCIV